MSRENEFMSISTGTMIRFLLVIGAILFAYLIKEVLIALFLAIIIASAIEPAVLWLKERKIPRILAVVFIYLAIAAVLLLFMYLIVPLLYEEAMRLGSTYASLKDNVL